MISFVLLRSSKGNGDLNDCKFADPDFNSRAAAAASVGLSVGAYHVAAITNVNTGEFYFPASEAQFFVSIAGNWIKAGNLRPCLDVEDHSCGNLSSYPGLVAWVDAWCQEVKGLTGTTPIIYCNGTFAALLQPLSSKYDLWIAKPGADPSSSPGMAPWNARLTEP